MKRDGLLRSGLSEHGPESGKNPGYYPYSKYYGKAGDILALVFGMSYQKNGAGSFTHRSDFLGFVGDLLFDKVLPNNMEVFTTNAQYKQFYANYSTLAFNDRDCFCMLMVNHGP